MIIREREEMNVKPCSCGAYPKFVQPNDGYTDIWLECPICGKQTKNTGGYHYASEIPLERAKRDAIIEWNKGEFTMNITINKGTTVQGNQVWINGTPLPPAPCKGCNSTVIDGKVFLDGYEYKNGKWKRTLRAIWHLWF